MPFPQTESQSRAAVVIFNMLVEGYTVRVQIYQLQDVTRNQESILCKMLVDCLPLSLQYASATLCFFRKGADGE
jgi:hypothetical protein